MILGPLSLGPLAIGAPWGLLALAALPAILAIHLFRRRSPPRTVSGLFLWPPPAPTPASGRRREQLVAMPSLWLELLAVLALAWWLADIHPSGDDRGRHLVLVLDDRQRLQALLPAGDSPAERVRATLAARLAALRASDRVTVIASGATPRLLCGPAAEPAQAQAAITAWKPTGSWHELEPALTLAAQLASRSGATVGAELLLASDRLPDDLDPSIGCEARGEAVPTSGLAEVRWLRDATGERLVVRIATSGQVVPRALEVRAGERVLARQLDASGTLLIPLPSESPEELTVALVGADPLPADDTVTLLRPPLRSVRVSVSGPFAASVQRVLAAVPGIAAGGATADLVIAETAAAPPGSWSLRIAPAPGDEAVLGPFLRRAGHPLCADLDGTGLLWVGGLPRGRLPEETTELVGGGDQALLTERRRGRDRLIGLYADTARGTLLQHPLWPALLVNVVEARRAALPGVASPTVPVGQTFTAVLPAGVERAELTGPDGSTATLMADSDGMVLVPALPLAGDWMVQAAAPATWQLRLRAIALDARLGDLAAARSATREPAAAEAVAVERRRSPAELLLPLVLAAGAAFGAWLCFGRGR